MQNLYGPPCSLEIQSPKLFTLVLEDIFEELDWEKKGIKIDGEYLQHLRFADDIVFLANNRADLQEMLLQLQVKKQNEHEEDKIHDK